MKKFYYYNNTKMTEAMKMSSTESYSEKVGKETKDSLGNLKEEVLSLTEEQKQLSRFRCSDAARLIKTYIERYMSRADYSEKLKYAYLNDVKKLCDKNSKIQIKSSNGEMTMSIDEFWENVKNKKIKLEEYWVSSVTFNEGEFNRIETTDWVEFLRKINKITLLDKNTLSMPQLEWVSDIQNAKKSNISEQQRKKMIGLLWEISCNMRDFFEFINWDKRWNDRLYYCNKIKEMCNKDARVSINFPDHVEEMSINKFLKKVRNHEINMEGYRISSVKFNEGEFIAEETYDWIEYRRKVSQITVSHNKIPQLEWVTDITISK